jgi:hypothetical protein
MAQYRQSGAIEPFEALHGMIRVKLCRGAAVVPQSALSQLGRLRLEYAAFAGA